MRVPHVFTRAVTLSTCEMKTFENINPHKHIPVLKYYASNEFVELKYQVQISEEAFESKTL